MKNWLKSSVLRVSLLFVGGMVVVFGALFFVLNAQSQQSFSAVVHGIHITQQPGEAGTVFIDPNFDILGQHVLSTNGELKRPQDAFVDRFQTSLLWMSLIGIGIALLLAAFITQQFMVLPLGRLKKAIKQLRQRNLTQDLERTGLPEFDEVVGSFNELAQELTRVEDLRRDLISDTSHELKTPLTGLQVQLEGMRDGLIKLDKGRVELLLKQVDRLNDLTDRLQEYARMRHRAATLEMTTFALLPTLQTIAAEQEADLKKAKLAVTIEVPEAFEVTGDKKMLDQVFSNLVRNVTLHAEAKHLTITAVGKTISFTDDGKGVPAEALEHLFERFYRVDRSRNREKGGLGLGLAIVREIIEAHGWTIAAEKADTSGLRVVLHLPN